MPEPDYQFLRQLDPEIWVYYDMAYRYAHEDPENSLVKLRACATLLVKLIYRFYQLESHGSLWDDISARDMNRYIPYHLQEQLNFLRIEGNKGAHPERSFPTRHKARNTALQALRSAYEAAVWVWDNIHGEDTDELPEYTPPTRDHSDKLYADAVIRNQSEAQYSVGMIFKQRAEEAMQAEQDEARQLKKTIWAGSGGDALEDAQYWFRKAADQNHRAALYQLGLMHLRGAGSLHHPLRGEQLIRLAAQQQYADALYQLGSFYLQGAIDDRHPYEKNYAQAHECFMQAAENEHPGALNQLVQMYYEGLGVARDEAMAFHYAHKAAHAGYPSAQFRLAYFYQQGMGTEADEEAALHWYEKAAEGGDPDAQVVMFKYYSNGLQVKKNLPKALEWLQKAELRSHPGACYYLGLAYKRGIGIAKNLPRALELFKRCIYYDTDEQYAAAKVEFSEAVAELREQAVAEAVKNQQAMLAQQPLPPALKPDFFEKKPGRNEPCPCGSGKKYKKCCGAAD